MQNILEVLQDTAIDTLKLLPFLFITYLIMEYIEHKTSNKVKSAIQKSGKFGPLIGGLLGTIPQCGFSVAATNLYATRIINIGTLLAVYLATSDEMIPIMISEGISIITIIKILGIKLIIAVIVGFLIDLIIQTRKNTEEEKIVDLCEKEHCDCEHGILKSALKHTVNIFVFIVIIIFIINMIVYFIGEENIANFLQANPVLAPVLASLIGLLPNCASSVILTQLYVQNVIPVSTMIAGLLVGAGVGLAVLFKMNKKLKENIEIVVLLVIIGTLSGIILQMLGINF